MIVIQKIGFDIHPLLGAFAVAMSFVLAMVAARSTGETDTTPIGAMGKVMQLLFAALAPKQIIPNLAGAGVAANAASSASDLLTDLKGGYLLGANPRRQFLAQFIGIFFGTQWMSMLFGFVFLSHQLGSFAGLWLAGSLYDATKSYDTMWWICIALAMFAALIHWPIRERPVARLAEQPAT